MRFWSDLAGRLTGPMTFRFFLQPIMATLYAIRDGIDDARHGRPPYFWALFRHPELAPAMLRDGLQSVGRVVALGVVMDAVYQLLVLRWIYPLELIVIVVMLAVLPYVLLRGPVNRIAAWWMHRRASVH